MFKPKKEFHIAKKPLQIEYFNDGSLYLPKKVQNEIINSIKQSKLKEIELLDFSINNLQTQLLIIKKMKEEEIGNIENTKRELIHTLKKEINPEILCSICFENIVNIVLTPCGHTFCDTCLGITKECYSCRGVIEKKYKIYFG